MSPIPYSFYMFVLSPNSAFRFFAYRGWKSIFCQTFVLSVCSAMTVVLIWGVPLPFSRFYRLTVRTPLMPRPVALFEGFNFAAAVGALPGDSAVPVETLSETSGGIAVAVPFDGSNVAYGDLISYDSVANLYQLARASGSGGVYGAVVQDPALLFKPGVGDGLIPVVRSGSVLVNVTLENGIIRVGDPLTVSSVSGKARLANANDPVFGTASEEFTGKSGVLLPGVDGKGVESGTIAVHLGISGGAPAAAAAAVSCASLQCRLLSLVSKDVALALSSYILAGLIASLSIIFAFRSFMADATNGVISIGRNPSAKASIRSLVFFNATLAVVIAGAGLLAAVVIFLAVVR